MKRMWWQSSAIVTNPRVISPYAHWYRCPEKFCPIPALRNVVQNFSGKLYFLGVGLGLWITWQVSTAVGVFLGAQIPTSWSLDFALPLTFIALVVPALKDRATVVTAIVAGAVALVALTMPFKLGLMTAILVAIGVGYAVEQWGVGDGEIER